MPALPNGRNFSINDKRFHFSVARSTMELLKGLSGTASLDTFDGMLFDFGYEMDVIMTPRGMLFPIEVAFIKANGTILEKYKLDPEFGHNVSSSEPVRFALEVPIGFFEQHGIDLGDTIEF